MTDASLIIPVTVANDLLLYAALVCIRTARATTDAEIRVVLNNTPDGPNRDALLAECALLNIDVTAWTDPFSVSATWNYGTRVTTGRLIAYANQDIVFYHGWLNAIIHASEAHPQYFVLWPWSFDHRSFGTSSRRDFLNGVGLLASDYPCGALSVLRRSDGYVWDERFSRWELDADFAFEMKKNGWRGACVLDSRVDHFVETVAGHIDVEAHYGQPKGELHAGATAALKAKWGL